VKAVAETFVSCKTKYSRVIDRRKEKYIDEWGWGVKVKKRNEKEGEESKTKGGGAEDDFFFPPGSSGV
jgi:hypothetical protein